MLHAACRETRNHTSSSFLARFAGGTLPGAAVLADSETDEAGATLEATDADGAAASGRQAAVVNSMPNFGESVIFLASIIC